MIVSNTAPHMTMLLTQMKEKGEEYEFDNYEDYVSSLPMGIEPISKGVLHKTEIATCVLSKIFGASTYTSLIYQSSF